MRHPLSLLVWKKFSPKVENESVQEALRKAKESMPIPVLWLLGKTQQGKTSIVRAITGNSSAEVGDGYRPCTRTAFLYPFPDEENCRLRFLDTRGLGEPGYDPAEDLAVYPKEAHCLIVVMKAMDPGQEEVLSVLKAVRKAHPRWPVIVCQTTLHEGYPSRETEHVMPYPYTSPPYPASVPHDLARALAVQREMLAPFGPSFVPVDLTFPEDGERAHEPCDYGLDFLMEVIDRDLPFGLMETLKRDPDAKKPLSDVYFQKAHAHVLVYAFAATGAGAIPIVDIPLLLTIQAKLFHTIASVYEQPMNISQMATISTGLGLGYVLRLGIRSLLKVIPGAGSAVSSVFAGASTYALGVALCSYFSRVQHGDVPDAREFRKLYQEELKTARQRLGAYLEQARESEDTK